ncbi:MAG: hypothetical protein WC901_04985 [Candidatus Margulisiibacteriota bacterium]
MLEITEDEVCEAAELSIRSLPRMKINGLTESFRKCLAEAASVCLEEQGHEFGTELNVFGDFERNYYLTWYDVDSQMLNCWMDDEVTTEHGAYGIATLLLECLTEYTVIRRSKKKTGFDFWLGRKGASSSNGFQNEARLEVSGIRKGSTPMVDTRCRQKRDQMRKSDCLMLTPLVVIVEFGEPCAKVVKEW